MSADLATFLERFRPDGYTTFVAIVPDGQTDAATFNGADNAAATRWIETRNRHAGVYFTVNPTPAPLRQKPTKECIAGIAGVWADVDPRDDQGRPIDQERARLAALAEELLTLDTPPSLIIDSGSGMQPLWLLADLIEASPEYRDAADALCARFEAALGAKGTHNCDRVLRVPGTINWPNKKKKLLGRGETQARIMAATWRRYTWSDLERLATRLKDEPPAHAVPIVQDPPGAGQRTGLRPEELDELRRSLTGDEPSGWLTAMLKMIGRLVRDGAEDWFIKDWALQYRWADYTEAQTLREIEPMIRGARKKGFDQRQGRPNGAPPDAAAAVAGDARLDLSHDGLALDMGRRWERQARHVALWGKWLFWTGARWEPDERLVHMTRCRDYLRQRADDLVRDAKAGKIDFGGKEPAKAVEIAETTAKSLRAAPMVANVVGMARSNQELVASVGQWDHNPALFGTSSGTVDLRTGHLRESRHADFMTKVSAVAPAATGTPAPIWQAFLDRIFRHDPELVPFIQRAVGYSLLGTVSAHVLLFCWGQGGNGKGVLLNTVSRILGDYAAVAPSDLLLVTSSDRHPCDMAMLRGARMVTAQELAPGRSWDEPKLKSLTGGDPITARFMRQDFFTYEPQFTLWVAGNHKPSFRGVDEAIKRRVLLVPFLQVIPEAERDLDLPEKLRAEWPAILRWAIDGCLAWQRQGLNPPASALTATKDYLDAEDALGQWLEERCVVHHKIDWTALKSLYADWCTWCGERGQRPGTARTLGKALDERGHERQRRTPGEGFCGVGLANVGNVGKAPNTRNEPPSGTYTSDMGRTCITYIGDESEPDSDDLEFYE